MLAPVGHVDYVRKRPYYILFTSFSLSLYLPVSTFHSPVATPLSVIPYLTSPLSLLCLGSICFIFVLPPSLSFLFSRPSVTVFLLALLGFNTPLRPPQPASACQNDWFSVRGCVMCHYSSVPQPQTSDEKNKYNDLSPFWSSPCASLFTTLANN